MRPQTALSKKLAQLITTTCRRAREARLRAEARATVEKRMRFEVAGGELADAQKGVFAWTTLPVAGKQVCWRGHIQPVKPRVTFRATDHVHRCFCGNEGKMLVPS